MALGEADGETVIVILRDDPEGAVPFSAIRIGLAGGRVISITDYIKCSWILETASITLTQGLATQSKTAEGSRQKSLHPDVSRRAPHS